MAYQQGGAQRGFKHAPQTPLNPGDRLHLSLYWQANVRPRADWWFDLTLADAGGRVVAQGSPADLMGSTDPEVRQFVRGEPDGPVKFHYPAPPLAHDFGLAQGDA